MVNINENVWKNIVDTLNTGIQYLISDNCIQHLSNSSLILNVEKGIYSMFIVTN